MFNKYQTSLSLIIVSLALLVSACSDSTSGVEEPISEVEVQKVEDLEATGENGEYTFFSLRSGQEVAHGDSATTEWDVAFNGTTIRFNGGVSGPGDGGALLLDVPFDEVSTAPTEGYYTDTDDSLAVPTGGGNGWYTYTGRSNPPHAVLPIEDRTIVLETADGEHYAKLKIISYYKGNPDTSTDEFANLETRPDSKYYTFRYAVQMTEGLRELN
ncbi:hypothetical protein CK503_05850 [Aliifodinibius salipaludis]|uniref:HmuY protein n=1 Tax=Fodinibius salipaludis TaxID=2032627 RepID=A0A2A2GDR1_9BACT|nr:HmuY family protein [Aliifodinibius salipaludis]PAU94985.1 hypothetical protein CK503_05850 [Aliifodinibius salipaludis]